MKFLHLGDLHIGKSVNDFNMIEDQKFILDEIFKMISEEKVDALLIAGDVYDKAIPSEEAVHVFDEFICRLANAKIPTFVISGNHDSDERLNFGSTLFERSNIFITSKFNGTLAKQTLEDEYGPVNIYLLPYVKASQVRRFYPEAVIDTYEDAVRTIIENTVIDPSERNVLVAHQFVAERTSDGKAKVEMGGSENLSVQNVAETVGTIEVIGHKVFDVFDYVALGHIHSAQKIGRDEVRYSGSPLKYSLTEVNHKKSVPAVELGKKDDVKLELLPLKPLREMRHLKGELKHIIDPKNVTDPDDYVFVTLTDEAPVQNVVKIIRSFYPNLMKLNYENSHSKEIAEVDFTNMSRNKSFEELISEFYMKMYGTDISEEELEIMKEVAREAGVVYEAD